VPQPPTRLSAHQRRSQLLDVAGRLFAESGFHGLSMERLAEAAGVSKPVVYQHFSSKRILYLTLLEDATTELDFRVNAALTGTSDNRSKAPSPPTSILSRTVASGCCSPRPSATIPRSVPSSITLWPASRQPSVA
jgi:AcrR family transcriptional regulator